MVTATPTTIIRGSLFLLGVIQPNEALGAADAIDSLFVLNSMIDRWGLQRQTMYTITRSEYTLTASVASFTIGTGGTFNQVRPNWIDNAAYLVPGASPDTEVLIAVDTEQSYQSNPQKALTGPLPVRIYYNPTSPLGTIRPWPVTTQNVTLVLYTPTAVTQFATVNTSVNLPTGYEFAMRYNLAVLLADTYGKGSSLSQNIRTLADDSLRDVKVSNYRMTDLGMDPGLWPANTGTYDIYSDVP